MNRAVIVVLTWTTVISCAGVRFGGGVSGTVAEHARLASSPSAADSLYLREMSAFMQIVAPRHWRDSLSHISNLSSFRIAVEEYFALRDFETRPDTPDRNEWREEMDRRVQYCRNALLTTIDAPMRDIRWVLVLPLGIPSFARRIPDTSTIDKYLLIWDTLGIEIACQSLNGGGVPVRYLSSSDTDETRVGQAFSECSGGRCRLDIQKSAGNIELLRSTAKTLGMPPRFTPFPGLDKIIHTNLVPLVFPNANGSSDLWIATLTRGDQFSDSTVLADEFKIELSIYDQSRRITGRDTATIHGLSQVASMSERADIAVPGYVGCYRLAPGHYEYVVSLRGQDHANLGVYRDTITIPPRRALRGASDVMIAFAPGVATGRGIMRHGMQLHANPSGTHAKSDSLAVYVEFPESAIRGDDYRVTVSLIPQKNAMVSWRTNTGREHTLYSSVLPRVMLDGKFRGTISLAGVKSGHYFLSVQIASQLKDPIGEEPVMAWTEIEVK